MSTDLIIPLESLNFADGLQKAREGLICLALAQSKGNRCKAARILGIHRNSLSRDMAKLELKEWPRERVSRGI